MHVSRAEEVALGCKQAIFLGCLLACCLDFNFLSVYGLHNIGANGFLHMVELITVYSRRTGLFHYSSR